MSQDILIKGFIKAQGEVNKGYIVADARAGIITDLGLNKEFIGKFYGKVYEYGSGSIIEAGDFNAHSHPEQSIYTDVVDKSWNLSTWCKNTIYKYSSNLEPKHIYLGCCRAFSRMIALGVTSVMVSFYCHNNSGNVYDREVIKAARDVGIRLYYGRMNYDIITQDAYEQKKLSQRSFYEMPDKAEVYFKELLQGINSPRIVIAPSIHSIHASTKEAIISAINLGNNYDRYIQFHLSEDEGDVGMSLKLYGLRPVEFLSRLVESGEVEKLDNLILSDCVWIDDREREIIKQHNMKVVLNPRMNARIKTGEADLEKLKEAGIDLYLGTDGEASNEDLSITGERYFLKNRFKALGDEAIETIGIAPIKFNEGFIGPISKGNFCDLKITRKGVIEDVFVGGERIVSNGKVTTIAVESKVERPLKNAVKELISNS